MAEDKVTAHGRELGAELRRRRERAGYNGQEMARRLGWSTTQVSRVEVGARVITQSDVAIYLSSCGVPRDEMGPILELAREAGRDHRFKSHGEKLPDELQTVIFHETTAVSIESYEPIFVPGLLQTEEYIRALLRENGMYDDDSIEFRVGARMARQRLLKRVEPPRCTFYVHENVMHTIIGSRRIMHEQLLQLVFLGSWQHCAVRVLPVAAGARGLAYSSFQLMSYAESDPVIYSEHEAVSLFLDRAVHVDHYREVLNRLDAVALGEGESRRLLADLANEFDRAEEGHDG
jgi:transcriptional regulator with XRE-family HTH domain